VISLFRLVLPVALAYSVTASAQIQTASNAAAAPQLDVRDRNVYIDDPAAPGSLIKKGITNVLLDQKEIWTSPFHMRKKDVKYLLLFGAATAALIATDHKVSKQLPASGTSVDIGTEVSRAGQYYSVYPFAGALFLAGAATSDEKLRNTGALGVQALIDADIVSSLLKVAVQRERPLAGAGGGDFEDGGSDFPSGHATQAWAIASVVAHEYRNHKWVPFVAYSYAAAVSASRVAARDHFPTDVFVGSALGYFIGRFVVNTNEEHMGHFRSRHAWTRPLITPYSDGSQSAALSLRWAP
jgi:membrane-associated phospholipid phosphatase